MKDCVYLVFDPGPMPNDLVATSSGLHDNYGSALTAQPGGSQGRPATNTSSRLIVRIGLPAPSCSRCLRPGWSHHTPQPFALRPDISTAIFIPVTNAIESLHRGLRKIIKTRGAFPSDEAAMKLLYLALRNLGVHWKPAIEWRAAYAQFAIFFPDRVPTTTIR